MTGLLTAIAEAIIRGLMVMAGYVSNSSTFPQPLPEDEEARYLARLQQGDEEARAVLIERNLRLVAHIVNTTWAELQVARYRGGESALFRHTATPRGRPKNPPGVGPAPALGEGSNRDKKEYR